MLRFNPHWHCIILEGGIDEEGPFHHIPIKDTSQLTGVFRRRVIKLFVDRGLLDRRFALKILSWKHSGFSVDNSVSIPASSRKARMNLSQYIVRHPVSLQKILYAPSNGTIIYKTKYNAYWKENIKLFKVTERSEGMPVVRPILSQSSPSISRQNTNISYGTMGCIPAGQRGCPLKMVALQSLGIKSHPTGKLPKTPSMRWRLFLPRHHGGAGCG
jgi:hypothetical protein